MVLGMAALEGALLTLARVRSRADECKPYSVEHLSTMLPILHRVEPTTDLKHHQDVLCALFSLHFPIVSDLFLLIAGVGPSW